MAKTVDKIGRTTNAYEIYSLANWVWRKFLLKYEIMKICYFLEKIK